MTVINLLLVIVNNEYQSCENIGLLEPFWPVEFFDTW